MLTLDQVVKVDIQVETSTAVSDVFDVGLIMGKSSVISTETRVATYASAAEMLGSNLFTTDSPEYLAAVKYFSASPAPASVVVGVIGSGESIGTAMAAVVNKTNAWYGVYLCGADEDNPASDADITAMDEWLNTYDRGVQFYGVKYESAATATASTSLFSVFKTKGTKRSLGMLVKTDVDDAAGLMGTAMGQTRTHKASSFALCYKSVPGADTLDITQTEVDSVKGVNANVYITRGYTRTMIENGATAQGMRYDEVMYLDEMKADLQDALVAVIADSNTKVPQNDNATTLFMNTMTGVFSGYTNRGILATGTWTGSAVGNVENGDEIVNGYTMYAESYAMQTQADREAHKAMPITACLCLAGSIESVELAVHVQR